MQRSSPSVILIAIPYPLSIPRSPYTDLWLSPFCQCSCLSGHLQPEHRTIISPVLGILSQILQGSQTVGRHDHLCSLTGLVDLGKFVVHEAGTVFGVEYIAPAKFRRRPHPKTRVG